MTSNKELRLKIVGVISSIGALVVFLTSILMLMKVLENEQPFIQIPLGRVLSHYNNNYQIQYVLPGANAFYLTFHPTIQRIANVANLDKQFVSFAINCGSVGKFGMLLGLCITGIVVSVFQFIMAHINFFVPTNQSGDNRSIIRKYSSLWMFLNMILLIPHFLLCILTFYYGQCSGNRAAASLSNQEKVMQKEAMITQKVWTDYETKQCQEKLCNLPEWFAYSNSLVINIGVLFVLISFAYFNIVKQIDFKEKMLQVNSLRTQHRTAVPNQYSPPQ